MVSERPGIGFETLDIPVARVTDAVRNGVTIMSAESPMILPDIALALDALDTGGEAASRFLAGFVAGLARDGTIGTLLERHGVSADCAVGP